MVAVALNLNYNDLVVTMSRTVDTKVDRHVTMVVVADMELRVVTTLL